MNADDNASDRDDGAASTSAGPSSTSQSVRKRYHVSEEEQQRLIEAQRSSLRLSSPLSADLRFDDKHPSTIFEHSAPILILYTGGTFGCTHKGQSLFNAPPDGELDLKPARANLVLDYLQALPELQVGDGKSMAPLIVDERNLDPGAPPPPLVFAGTPEPIDSAEADVSSWRDIIVEIYMRRHIYSAFVVIHGTDTLAYTATALVMAFDKITLPIVLTGSQAPINYGHSDALNNLLGACEAAGWAPPRRHYTTLFNADNADKKPRPMLDVMVFFNTRLLQATRVVKTHSSDWDAFQSPNSGVTAYYNGLWHENPQLVKNITWRVGNALPDLSEADRKNADVVHATVRKLGFLKWKVYLPNIMHKVLLLKLFPGCLNCLCFGHDEIDALTMSQRGIFLAAPFKSAFARANDKIEAMAKSVSGIVVEVYGAGNAPAGVQYVLGALHGTYKKPVAYVTECRAGSATANYSVKMGVGVNMNDCTASAAYVKMVFLISRAAWYRPGDNDSDQMWRRDWVDQEMAFSYRGEFGDDGEADRSLRVTRY